MPVIEISVGNRRLALAYKDGPDGYINIQDTQRELFVHIHENNGRLIGLVFWDESEAPAQRIDLDKK